MVSDMGIKALVLTGKHVRLEPLEHNPRLAAACGDVLYQWSPCRG
jgi:hypothetical protein